LPGSATEAPSTAWAEPSVGATVATGSSAAVP
jgi:hypothetical protein